MRVALLILWLSISTQAVEIDLEKLCIECHRAEGIPSRMINKRYFMNYSSQSRVASQMRSYLKNPDRQNSILPRQFRPKGGDKKPTTLTDTELDLAIDQYIYQFDIRRRLVLDNPKVDEK